MRTLSRFVSGVLERVETQAAMWQGKGFGTSSVDHEVAAIRFLLPAGLPVRHVVDVGANYGIWTAEALAAFPEAKLHLFEPSTTCLPRLRARYDTEPRVTINPKALSAESGRGVLHSDVPGSGLASLTRRNLDHVDLSMDEQEDVDVTTLDEYVAAAGIERVDVLKIDVEGHELDVLRGATQTLATISAVQFEVGGTNVDTRTFFRDYWYLLTEQGFTFWRIGPWGVQQVPRYRESEESFLCTNYVAVRSAE